MHDNQRRFARCQTRGVALIYDYTLETAYLQDIGLGGMKVSSKSLPSSSEIFWVEFTLIKSDNSMIFGKRTKANLIHSKFNHITRRFTLGFHFLDLSEFQCGVINSVFTQ